jgi:outer membrane protein assembly factor BamD
LFLLALCSVKNSPNWTLDQTETLIAINNVQDFVDRYPASNLIDSCNRVIDRLRFKLEQKDYHKVALYSKTENYRSAMTAADIFNDAYPRSIYREEIKYLAIINNHLLANNSIESKKNDRIEQTIERYRNFAVEFPSSAYLKELEELYNRIKSNQ